MLNTGRRTPRNRGQEYVSSPIKLFSFLPDNNWGVNCSDKWDVGQVYNKKVRFRPFERFHRLLQEVNEYSGASMCVSSCKFYLHIYIIITISIITIKTCTIAYKSSRGESIKPVCTRPRCKLLNAAPYKRIKRMQYHGFYIGQNCQKLLYSYVGQ